MKAATAVALSTRPVELESGDKPLVHAVCRVCWPEPVPEQIAMCGAKPATPATDPVPDPSRPWCAVCMDLYPKPCGRCSA